MALILTGATSRNGGNHPARAKIGRFDREVNTASTF
jgi:hypothetical protein